MSSCGSIFLLRCLFVGQVGGQRRGGLAAGEFLSIFDGHRQRPAIFLAVRLWACGCFQSCKVGLVTQRTPSPLFSCNEMAADSTQMDIYVEMNECARKRRKLDRIDWGDIFFLGSWFAVLWGPLRACVSGGRDGIE